MPRWDASKPIYRHMERQWAEALLQRGSIRIGTLSDFRREEVLGAEQGDAHEGVTINVDQPGPITSPEQAREQSWLFGGAVDLSNVQNCYVDIKVAQAVEHPDRFCLCFSESSDQALGVRLLPHAPPDERVCVEIHSPERFLYWITVGLTFAVSPVRFFSTLRPCAYSGNEVPVQAAPFASAFLKSPRYAYQKEWRALWETKAGNPRPLVLEVQELTECCRLLY